MNVPKVNDAERVACEQCGAAAGEPCNDQTAEQLYGRRVPNEHLWWHGGGDREIAGWFPELSGDELVAKVRSERERLR